MVATGCSRRSGRAGLALAALAALCGLACGQEAAPGTRVCAEILSLRAPGAQLVETWLGTGGVAVDYRFEGEPADSSHRLDCALEETEPGRLRARALHVDGRALPETELLLVNSELLLAEIRRADPGSPAEAGRWTDRLARLFRRS